MGKPKRAKLKLGVLRLNQDARLPAKVYRTDAGFDVRALEKATLRPGARRRFLTGLAFDIPEGFCLVCMPKSGSSWKHGLACLSPLIDASYTGETSVVLVNLGRKAVTFRPGDKLAQYVLAVAPDFEIVEVSELPEKERGNRGFGSSGK